MFKAILINLINFYQTLISPGIKVVLGVGGVCRFDETCSAYTKRKIHEKGALKGTGLGLARLLRCQPLTS